MIHEEKIVEPIVLYIFERALSELKEGPLPIVEKYYIESDGEDIRLTLKIAGSTKTYLFSIIELLDPKEVKFIMDEFYMAKKRKIDNFINTIRQKGI